MTDFYPNAISLEAWRDGQLVHNVSTGIPEPASLVLACAGMLRLRPR